MKKKIIRDISANLLQVIINQFCGFVIFYLISTSLDKNDFGEINWTLALLLAVFGILSLGLDQISVRKIASGNDPGQILSIYFVHVLLTGLLMYAVLIISFFLFDNFFRQHHLLLLLGMAKLAIFFSSPFKQVAIGLEKFRTLLIMSTCSNLVRSLAFILIALTDHIGLANVILIFIAGDATEFLLSFFIVKYSLGIRVRVRWDKKKYFQLIKESIPQAGTVIFNMGIARFDWILLGLIVSNLVLAEYSFAYKIFEFATLPLLIIAPVLLTRFTKFFTASNIIREERMTDILALLRFELVVASTLGLILTICWSQSIDLITHAKYGAVNFYTISILSVSMPFLYFNNLLWSINFAKGRINVLFYNIMFTFLVNLFADVVLIPILKAQGAAIGFLIAIIFQAVYYLIETDIELFRKKWYFIFIYPLTAIVSALLALETLKSTLQILIMTLVLFYFLLFSLRLLKKADWLIFRKVAGF